MGWLLRLTVDEPDRELVSSLLWDAGTTGIVEDGDVMLAGFEDRGAADVVAARAGEWPAEVLAVEPVEWWGTDDATTVEVPLPDGGTRVVTLVAGPTFGHGGHPTTALALDLLVDAVKPGDRVLDVGTGSGVLAIAAALRDAEVVVGTDIDPAALPVARANAEANGVEIAMADVPVAETVGLVDGHRFDVVVANVLLVVQRELAASLAGALAPEGILITSGHLSADGDEVDALHRHHLGSVAHTTVRERDGWLAHRFDRCCGRACPQPPTDSGPPGLPAIQSGAL